MQMYESNLKTLTDSLHNGPKSDKNPVVKCLLTLPTPPPPQTPIRLTWSNFSMLYTFLFLHALALYSMMCNVLQYMVETDHALRSYLIFVIFFTQAKFLENKIYTEKRQFFALNL